VAAPDRSRDVIRLRDSSGTLWRGYDVAMLDLDGVVYRGGVAISEAAERLGRARANGLRLAFVTNNASLPPSTVAARLRRLGIEAAEADVVTSAQAAARLVAELVPPGAKVLVIGGEGLESALVEHDLIAVSSERDEPVAVVQGFGADVGWRLLAEAAYAVAAGLPWVASNLDLTVPTDRGIAPGNGSLVAAVVAATGQHPVVAGKPEPALFDETMLRVGGRRPLVVGDRLDTDIEGANRVGADSLLVLTGVTTLEVLAAAKPPERPTFVAPDLGGLEVVHPSLQIDGDTIGCAGQWVRLSGDELVVDSATTPHAQPESAGVNLVRAAVGAAWHHLDSGAETVRMNAVQRRLHEMMV